MRFGYVVPNSWGLDDPREVIGLAVRGEELGVDSLWVSHHVLHAGFVAERLGRRPYHDPLVMLAALATATSRARLGTSVMVLPYLHPMPTAKAVATIDHLSGGRLDLGVGVGGLREEHDAIGQVPFEQRGRYADEFLQVLELLWSPGPSSFTGSFFSFEGVEAYPGPVRAGGLPVFVGGHGRPAAVRAARFGTGWQGVGVEPDPVRAQRSQLAEALAARGRSLDGFGVQVRLHVPVEDVDVDAWRDRFAAYGEAGVDELLLAPQSGDLGLHRQWLDTLVPALGS
ncbi:MAG TPA: TIGR03619 family F420-dependent LLM class oxidoreductase [Acidimicrobiales bacterium]|nr:TIGR03619 family F420-dependent LLM class oxidoreductase [Acidimicrobiales bacterium]